MSKALLIRDAKTIAVLTQLYEDLRVAVETAVDEARDGDATQARELIGPLATALVHVHGVEYTALLADVTAGVDALSEDELIRTAATYEL
jgi:hypothetical protein